MAKGVLEKGLGAYANTRHASHYQLALAKLHTHTLNYAAAHKFFQQAVQSSSAQGRLPLHMEYIHFAQRCQGDARLALKIARDALKLWPEDDK